MRAPMLKLLAAVLLAGALGACTLMSKNPAAPEATALAEPGLYGSWMSVGDGELSVLHIYSRNEAKDNLLTLVFAGGDAEDGGWYALNGHVSALPDGRRYLNLSIAASTPDALKELDATYPDRAEYPYSFLPYKVIDADNIQIGAAPFEEIMAAVKGGTLAGVLVEDTIPVAKLTDTSENITAFLATQDEAKAFAQPLKFTRIKAPPAP